MTRPKSPAEFFQPGAVVYFQKCHRAPKKKSDAMQAPGGMYAFGLFLGVVPPFTPQPTEQVIFPICANFGMVTIDSIIELMGQEIATEYLARLQAKYAKTDEGALVNPPAPESGLVDSSGRHLGPKLVPA